ncbi:MAG: FecR family protein [Methanimicrococcus sp.]|nr:FecR family protein [Methanimicrococcus sp.]
MFDPPDAKNTITSVSDGSASIRTTHPDSGDSFQASMNWNSPDSYYKEGSLVELTLSIRVDSYVWTGKNDGYIHEGINYPRAQIYAALDSSDIGFGGGTARAIYLEDKDGNYTPTVYGENGKTVVSSQSYTVFAPFPKGYKDGDRISLHVRCGDAGLARYDYVWDTGDAPAEPTRPESTQNSSFKGLSGRDPFVYHRPPPAPGLTEGLCKIGDLYGEVDVRQNDEDDDAYIFAWSGMQLYHNDRVKTLTRSGCIISFSDMSTFVMKEDCTIVMDLKNEKESKIALVAGNLWTNLKRMTQDGGLEVEMSQAIAGARGTTFICEENDGISTVKVFEGTVEVTSKETGNSVMVGGGEMYRIDGSGQGTLTTFDTKAELADWDAYVRDVTTEAMKEPSRKSGGFSMVLMVAAFIFIMLVLLAAVFFVFIAARNKNK